MDDMTWWRRWFDRHPLKSPAADTAFTAEVMRRVRASAPRPAPAAWAWRWLPVPVLAGAAALLVVTGRVFAPEAPQTAEAILSTTQQLAALEDEYDALMEDAQGQGVLANGWEELDRMMFAEAASEDVSWLEELSQTLDELDEENVSGAADGGDEEWWKELETLESDSTSASS
jgi:hypothetical protein